MKSFIYRYSYCHVSSTQIANALRFIPVGGKVQQTDQSMALVLEAVLPYSPRTANPALQPGLGLLSVRKFGTHGVLSFMCPCVRQLNAIALLLARGDLAMSLLLD